MRPSLLIIVFAFIIVAAMPLRAVTATADEAASLSAHATLQTGRRTSPRRPSPRPTARRSIRPTGARRYDEYRHDITAHRENCAQCHTVNNLRSVDEQSIVKRTAISDFPNHDACIDCHRPQFFAGARPAICTVCHTVVSPRSDARFEFPKSKGEFQILFPHDRHQLILAQLLPAHAAPSSIFVRTAFTLHTTQHTASTAQTNQASTAPPSATSPSRISVLNQTCAACHATDLTKDAVAPDGWLELKPANDKQRLQADNSLLLEDASRRLSNGTLIAADGKPTPVEVSGTFQLSPRGASAHATCFTCHFQTQKPVATDCQGCHTAARNVMNMSSPASLLASDATNRQPSFAQQLNEREEQNLAASLRTRRSRRSKPGSAPALLAAHSSFDRRWRHRISAKFRHEDSNHNSISCTSCHTNIFASQQTATVAARVPFATCAGCHVKNIRPELAARTNDVNFKCAYCHLPFDEGARIVPRSHYYGGAIAPLPPEPTAGANDE